MKASDFTDAELLVLCKGYNNEDFDKWEALSEDVDEHGYAYCYLRTFDDDESVWYCESEETVVTNWAIENEGSNTWAELYFATMTAWASVYDLTKNDTKYREIRSATLTYQRLIGETIFRDIIYKGKVKSMDSKK